MTAPLVDVGLFAVLIGASLFLGARRPVLVIPSLLIAGVAVGPHGLRLLRDVAFIDHTNDVGMVLLLFYTALFTHPHALRRGGRMALPLAAYDLVLNFAAAYWIGSLFGWDLDSKLVLAGVITTSSTGTILKILSDEGRLLRREGNVLVALLWFEDLAFLGYFIFLSGREHLQGMRLDVHLALGVLLFVGFLGAVRLGREALWRIPQKEILIPIVTGIGLVGAYMGTLAGLPAQGAAFTTGLVAAGSRGARFVQAEAPYLREVSSAAFFLAFGAQIDPTVVRYTLPLAAACIVGLLLTEFLFLPLIARLLGLSAPESLVLGSSILARGGKSASFAQLGAAVPAGAAIQSVSGLLALALTPIAPFLVRLVLRLRDAGKGGVLQRADVLGQFSRRVLDPGAYAQRHLVTAWERIALVGWFLLPFQLGILAALVPIPWRLAPVAVGAAVLPFSYKAIRRYYGRAPGTPGMTYKYRRKTLPRVDMYLPQLLMGPCVLALVLPLAAPWSMVAFPIAGAATLLFVLILPWFVHRPRSAPFTGVVVRRPQLARF